MGANLHEDPVEGAAADGRTLLRQPGDDVRAGEGLAGLLLEEGEDTFQGGERRGSGRRRSWVLEDYAQAAVFVREDMEKEGRAFGLFAVFDRD